MAEPLRTIRRPRFLRFYHHAAFDRAKNTLLKLSEGRKDCLNFGYWPQAEATPNPPVALILATAQAARIKNDDRVLDVGSGLGGGARLIFENFHPRRVLGINISSGQVESANERLKAENLFGPIEHRLIGATEIAHALRAEGITNIVAVDAIDQFADLEAFFDECSRLLPSGGRLTFSCRLAKEPATLQRRALGNALRLFGRSTYGRSYRHRPAGFFVDQLTKRKFSAVEVTEIGDRVFPYTHAYARSRFPALRRDAGVPAFLAWAIYLQFPLLSRLYRLGALDYALISALKK